MKIVLVNSAWENSWGGGEKWTVEAGMWLRDHGHDVLVVGRPAAAVVDVARIRKLDVQETPFGGDLDPLALLRAGNILRNFHAEIVCVNFNKEAWQFGLAALSMPIPVVARHGLTVLSSDWHHRLLAQRVLTKLVVNATAIRDEYARRGLPADDIEVISNGIRPVQQFSGKLRARLKLPPKVRLAAGVGRLESQKRMDIYLDVAASLALEFDDVHFVIAGDGVLRQELERQAAALRLADRVTFTGFLPEMQHMFCDVDLFFLTSEEEGTPNALLEAMVVGVPCVAFGVGNVAEMMSGELAPYCIPRGDTATFTAQAAALLKDDELRQSVGQKMQERAASDFSFEHSMQRFEDLFLKLVAA